MQPSQVQGDPSAYADIQGGPAGQIVVLGDAIPSFPLALLILPISHQPSDQEGGIAKILVNQTHLSDQMYHPVEYPIPLLSRNSKYIAGACHCYKNFPMS